MLLRPVRIALAAGPLVACALAALNPGAVFGLPSFSRAYGVPCRQCHGTFSGLSRGGMQFLRDGFRLRGAHAEVLPPPRREPLSVVADMSQDFASADRVVGAGSLRARGRASETRRGSIGLHAAGTLSGRATYHVAGTLPSGPGEPVTNTAFVQVNDLVRGAALNLKAGDFLVQGPYLALSRADRFRDYLSNESLPARGLELNGAAGAWRYGAGLIRSRRALPNGGTLTRVVGRLEDTYYWLGREIGGQEIGVRMLFDRQDSNLAYLAWLQHLQAQVSALLAFGRVELVPAYALDRFDDRPGGGIHQRRQTALLEARVPLDATERWKLTAFAEHDYTTRTVLSREADRHEEALELGFDVRQNAEVAVEWRHAADNVAGPRVDELHTWIRFGY
jgi:hypothetical protein